jgi:ubiquinone biosynthesis protein
LSRPEHLRCALEELGTTFIKLGQILSTRGDLLTPEYLAELSKLQDAAASVPFEAVRDTLITELGQPIEKAFSHFDPEPLAAASIGQAHAATLPNGTEVVVKIRRPGVVEQVNEDLKILRELAEAADRHWEFADRYDLVGIVRHYGRNLTMSEKVITVSALPQTSLAKTEFTFLAFIGRPPLPAYLLSSVYEARR